MLEALCRGIQLHQTLLLHLHTALASVVDQRRAGVGVDVRAQSAKAVKDEPEAGHIVNAPLQAQKQRTSMGYVRQNILDRLPDRDDHFDPFLKCMHGHKMLI